MTLGAITDALERLAPLRWQEDYDNSGLQVALFDKAGAPLGREAEVAGVLVCIDITEAVIDEAVSRGCNLVVAHHPLIFRPLKNVTGASYQQRCVAKALCNGVALYAAHTNLDNAPGGVSWEMAARIGLREVRTLVSLPSLPASDTGAASAPSGNSNACPVIPSDSPAACSSVPSSSPATVPGSGVIGVLPEAMEPEAFARRLADLFAAPALRWSCSGFRKEDKGSESGGLIRTVALCGGSGGELIRDAVAAGADCYVTGEIRYHDYFEADGCMLVALGHYESEQYTMDLLLRYLKQALSDSGSSVPVPLHRSAIVTNPLGHLQSLR